MITVRDLKKILRRLPNSMKVTLGVGESLEDICAASIEVIKVEFTDDEGGFETLLVLPVCKCNDEEIEIEDSIVNPELN